MLEEVFKTWLESQKSENTKKRYGSVVPEFFQIVIGKELSDIKEGDMRLIDATKVQQEYFYKLKKRGLTDTSIKSTINVISSFMTYVETYGVFPNVNFKFIQKIALDTRLFKNDTTSTQAMSVKDYEGMKVWLIERFKGSRYEEKGEQYSLLLEFMWNTASRINAVMNVTWDDAFYEKDSLDIEGWAFRIKDKGGKLNYKPIQDETLYERLKEAFWKGDSNDKIFGTLSDKGFASLLKEYSEPYGGGLTPHSVKKGAVTTLYRITNDINLCKDFADHEDVATTLGYIESEQGRQAHGSYYLNLKSDDLEVMKNFSGEVIYDLLLKNGNVDLISKISILLNKYS